MDTLGGDEDGRADAGETVELVVKLKNTGGYNDSVWASIELDGLEDPSLVNFIDSVRFFGSVSEYATIENNVPDSLIFPFKFTLDSDIANARGIKFKINIWTSHRGSLTKIVASVITRISCWFTTNNLRTWSPNLVI